MSRPFVVVSALVFCLAVGAGLLGEAGWRDLLERWRALGTGPASPVVARVLGAVIDASQLERAMRERLWLEGKALESQSEESRQAVRQAALDELIDGELLGAEAAAIKVTAAEIDVAMAFYQKRFYGSEELAQVIQAQGLGSERQLRARLAARIQQQKWIEMKIAPLVSVSETEVRQWYDANRACLTNPERLEVRHIFLPTLDHPADEARAKLAAALADLTSGKQEFDALARSVSEDPATRETGGNLGWMSRDRLPADFADAVFALALHQPALVRSRLGWHLVEVTGRQPAQLRAFDQAAPEIRTALETAKRRDACQSFRADLRRAHAAQIEIIARH